MPENLFTHPIHLGLGAKALAQRAFTGMEWCGAYFRPPCIRSRRGTVSGAQYLQRKLGQLGNAPQRRRSCALHQQHTDGTTATVHIGPGEYIINPPGCWHTADVKDKATALFITAGEGTEHKPR